MLAEASPEDQRLPLHLSNLSAPLLEQICHSEENRHLSGGLQIDVVRERDTQKGSL